MSTTNEIEVSKIWRKFFGRGITDWERRKMQWAARARHDGGLSPNIGGMSDGTRWIGRLRDAGLIVCARKRARERNGHARDSPMGGWVASELGARLFAIHSATCDLDLDCSCGRGT